MNNQIVLVMDCGATNVRTVAVNAKGELVAMHSMPNNTQPDPDMDGGRIWDVKEIWDKLVTTTREVMAQVDPAKVAAVTVTTFGVNGAPMTKEGEMVYPVISWQCGRTVPVMNNIDKYIPLKELFGISGVQPFNFNTISYFAWFKENRPDVLDKMDYWVFIPSIFIYYLSGKFCTDKTMAGTSMLTDLDERDFSGQLLDLFGVDQTVFPNQVEPGEVVGKVTDKASGQTGIPVDVPVIATGHDTQYAIFGSGADEDVPVVSTGTWEILMVRSKQFSTTPDILNRGITIEYDPVPGFYNPGCQWVASGVLEWFKKTFYDKEKEQGDIYDIMIAEGEAVSPGAGGVTVNPSFFAEKSNDSQGTITGLKMDTSRGQIYRAVLEAMVCKLKHHLSILEESGGFKTESLIVVGGGAKNRLWNQIRADMLGVPIKIIDKSETTVLGAALFAMSGAGIYSSAEEARDAVDYGVRLVEPQVEKSVYEPVYRRFLKLNESDE